MVKSISSFALQRNSVQLLTSSMHTDICEPSDKAQLERLKHALDSIGATLKGTAWALGVSISTYQVADEELILFSDTWSIDIEASPELTKQIISTLQPEKDEASTE